jgi:D-xylose transport system permease protein
MSTTDEPTPKSEPAKPAEVPAADMSEAAKRDAALALPPSLAANSLGGYFRTSLQRIRAGESGVLPVLAGLVLVSILFQSLNSNFLTAGNLVNLLVQAAVFIMLAMAEVFVLVLGEIDLSVGYVAGLGGVIMAYLAGPKHNWSWELAILAALVGCAAIGLLQGFIITRFGLPSFVVTLAGFLFWEGVLLRIIGEGGTIPIDSTEINNIASANLSNRNGWILMVVIVVIYAAFTWRKDAKRRNAGLVAPPVSVTILKVAGAAIGGVALVLLCNHNRGVLAPISGVPWVVLIVLAVLVVYTVLFGRTKLGRYWYAIGGNAEAARRAGVGLAKDKMLAFMMCSFTAGIAGIIYASRLQSISTTVDGGTLVLYAVAAAVIGGTSLFGGRGKPVHGVLGGIVIAAIANGMGLMGYTASSQLMVTALVLLAAVLIDAVSRKGRVAGL